MRNQQKNNLFVPGDVEAAANAHRGYSHRTIEVILKVSSLER
jgi:hypothetical protein